MKLMICIMQKRYTSPVSQKLNDLGYRVTRLASTSGFMKQGNDTLLIGVSNEDADDLSKKLREVVLEVEQKKNWKTEGSRYTMFAIDAQNRMPE
jgi:uncharacterized protein YaaQ